MMQSKDEKIIKVNPADIDKNIEEFRLSDVNDKISQQDISLIDKSVDLIKSNVITPVFLVSSLSGQGIK